MPVAQVWGTALIAISSPGDSDNWFSRIMRFKNQHGYPLFFSYQFRDVCKNCRKLEPSEMIKCTHMKNAQTQAFHKDREKRSKHSQAYQQQGMGDRDLEENFGIITRSENCAFSEDLIRHVFEGPRTQTIPQDVGYDIKEVVVCVDPNGGGSSRTAIVIGYLNQRTNEIVVSFL